MAPWIIMIVIFLLGIVLTALRIRNFGRCTERVEGKVAGCTDIGDSESTKYCPTVEYTRDGVTGHCYYEKETFGSREACRKAFPKGTKLTMYINPDNPRQCSYDPSAEIVGGYIALCALVVLLLMAVDRLADML